MWKARSLLDNKHLRLARPRCGHGSHILGLRCLPEVVEEAGITAPENKSMADAIAALVSDAKCSAHGDDRHWARER